MQNVEGQPSTERLGGMVFGFAPPLMLEAAVQFKVFDLLDGGPKSLDELTAATGASQRGLRMLLDGLVGLELLRKEKGQYDLTAESAAFLVSGKPAYQGGMFRHVSGRLMKHWMHLGESVRTGKPAASVNREEFGGPFFREFVEDLFPRGYPAARRLAETLDIEHVKTPVKVLDLAAGSGVWSIALAERSHHVTVTAVDWPEVIPVTMHVAQRQGVADRYRFVEGDLLEADFGHGHNVAVLGHILHSEGEDRSRRLLEKVFHTMAPGGVIAIAEMVPNDNRTGPAHALLFALNMLVHTDEGDAFTFSELSGWLRDAGFLNPRQLEVPAPSPLILADKPEG
jgi:SAM-dependent methyltransferase